MSNDPTSTPSSNPSVPVWPALEPFVAALERHLDTPRATTSFAVDDDAIARASAAFCRAAQEAFAARIDATSAALTSSWPKDDAPADADASWHIDTFVARFLAHRDESELGASEGTTAIVDAPIVPFALGALWARHLAHRFAARWVGGARIDMSAEDFTPSSIRISGFATVTFPFQRALAKLRAPDDGMWTSTVTLADALPPLGLAFDVEDARGPHVLEQLMPRDACAAFRNMQIAGAEATLASLDEVLEREPRHALVLTLAMGIASGGDLVRAAGYARRVMDVHRSLDTRYRLADVLACIDDTKARAEAIEIFRPLLDEQPQMHRTRLKLAYCLADDGQTDAAIAELNTLVEKGWGDEVDAAKEMLAQLTAR